MSLSEHTVPLSRLCTPLRVRRSSQISSIMRKEQAEWKCQALKKQRALLAQACLGSDDNHMTCVKKFI